MPLQAGREGARFLQLPPHLRPALPLAGVAQVSPGLPQVHAGGGAAAGGADLQGQIRGGQVLLPQYPQAATGAGAPGPHSADLT